MSIWGHEGESFTTICGSVKFRDYSWYKSRSGIYTKIFHSGPYSLPPQPYLNLFPKLGPKYLIKERILKLTIKFYNHCAIQSYTLTYDTQEKKSTHFRNILLIFVYSLETYKPVIALRQHNCQHSTNSSMEAQER